MLKLHKLCNVCKHAEDNPKLLKAIYDSKAFIPGSSVSLKNVWDAYSQSGAYFSYEALLNHSKKHQFMNEKDFNSRHLRQIAKDAEKKILKRSIESGQVWDKVIEVGMQGIEDGTLVMKTADLLKAAKDKSDYELKTKDQQLAYAEMMYYFASGESEQTLRKPYDRKVVQDDRKYVEGTAVEHQDAATGAPEDSAPREDGPSGVYYPPSWDAPTFGASPLPAGNDF